MIQDDLGKKAEQKIKKWLDRPQDGYCLDRIPDQMTGFYGSRNICDFILFKTPNFYYIESKATWSDRFDFSRITEYQYENLLKKSAIPNVYGAVIVLFASVQRAFIFNIQDIHHLIVNEKKKSLNIKKVKQWTIPYHEIETIASKKTILDYKGEFVL